MTTLPRCIRDRPKGVMLSHGNLLHQLSIRFAPTKKYDVSEPLPGDVMVTVLPSESLVDFIRFLMITH